MGRALLHWWLSFRMRPRCCTDAFGPNSWFGGCNSLHRCCTVSTTSRHCFLPRASSTFARPYLGSCWHPSDLLMVRHVVRSPHRSLCSEGELSGLFLIVHWQIPSTGNWSKFCGLPLWRNNNYLFIYLFAAHLMVLSELKWFISNGGMHWINTVNWLRHLCFWLVFVECPAWILVWTLTVLLSLSMGFISLSE
jgi:hypothetical protein